MILPCPICSAVVYAARPEDDKPIIEGPSWIFAKTVTRARGKDHFAWGGCKHANAVHPQAAVETEMRAMTEARWNVEARRLLEERTAKWPAEQRERFAAALGFRKQEVEA